MAGARRLTPPTRARTSESSPSSLSRSPRVSREPARRLRSGHGPGRWTRHVLHGGPCPEGLRGRRVREQACAQLTGIESGQRPSGDFDAERRRRRPMRGGLERWTACHSRPGRHVQSRVRRKRGGRVPRHPGPAHMGLQKAPVGRRDPVLGWHETYRRRDAAHPNPRGRKRSPSDIAEVFVAHAPRDPCAGVVPSGYPQPATRTKGPASVVKTDPSPRVIAHPDVVARDVAPTPRRLVRLEARVHLVAVGYPRGAVGRVFDPRTVGVESASKLAEGTGIGVGVVVPDGCIDGLFRVGRRLRAGRRRVQLRRNEGDHDQHPGPHHATSVAPGGGTPRSVVS